MCDKKLKMKIVKKKTNQLSNSEIKKIIRIKMQFWKYSFKSQNKWFIDKIKSNDLHFFIGSKFAYFTFGFSKFP